MPWLPWCFGSRLVFSIQKQRQLSQVLNNPDGENVIKFEGEKLLSNSNCFIKVKLLFKFTHRNCRIMKIILKYCVKVMKQSMLRCIITTIAEIKTSKKSSYLSIITISLCINKDTLLMVCEDSSYNLDKNITLTTSYHKIVHHKASHSMQYLTLQNNQSIASNTP